ncbi:hypothetical protein [Kluyvera ascorbata]|uniref:hypothetical protein n=1 Tax=Kluyvera ascorbata TaxID=51288 RepID=UPI0022E21324|nr:hypothetical protein [Kluyvera ascorbata]
MSYGAFIQLDNGNSFVTPDSAPIRLKGYYDFPSVASGASHIANGSIAVDTTKPFIPFCCCLTTSLSNLPVQTCVYGFSVASNNAVNVSAFGYSGNNTRGFTLRVFMFTQEAQPYPEGDYGMAIFNADGELILTNKDRVLTDVISVGGGSSMPDITMAGRWAVVPSLLGMLQYYVAGGGPGGAVFSVPAAYGTIYNGSSTRITGGTTTAPPSNQVTGSALIGRKTAAINIDNYM